MLIYALVNCRELHLRAFCRQIHQCAKIGGQVEPILAMPRFWEHLLRRYVPKSCHVSKKMKSSGQKKITGDVEEEETGNDFSELKVRFDCWQEYDYVTCFLMAHVSHWLTSSFQRKVDYEGWRSAGIFGLSALPTTDNTAELFFSSFKFPTKKTYF